MNGHPTMAGDEARQWLLTGELDAVLEAAMWNARRLDTARYAVSQAAKALDPLLLRAKEIMAQLAKQSDPRFTIAEMVASNCEGAADAGRLLQRGIQPSGKVH